MFRLLVLSVVRTVLTTGHRMVYPFRTAIARGLGVETKVIDRAIALRWGLGLFGPLFGTLADARGRRFAMITGLSLFAASMFLVAAWPTVTALFIALVVAGAAKIVFDSAAHAHIGDVVQYSARGRAIGVYELSWSWAFVIGMPAAGWLMSSRGWSAPFPWLGAMAAASILVILRTMPADRPRADAPWSFRAGLSAVVTCPGALAAVSVSALISFANEIVLIVFAQWLEVSFAMTMAGLGLASTVIGISELSGEGLVVALSDRLGKRRTIASGIAVAMLASAAMPWLADAGLQLGLDARSGALTGLFVFFFGFEVSLVTTISLVSELSPTARGALLAANLAAQSIGRAAGALIGPVLFSWGFLANGIAAALVNALALCTILFLVRDHRPTPSA